jgi:nitrite reductase/ring-hydroxylating ferredoxin subunit
LSKIESEGNVHFKVTVQDNNLTFMAYIVDGNPIVRASICPPCRSQSFTLKNKTLVCDRCATVFDARTGAGISGACVNYPKASVAYNLENGKLTIKIPDMNTAYQNTEKPGLP